MIRFTQFTLPRGRRDAVTIDRPAEVEAQAARLTAAGCRFEIEVLRNGVVGMEVMDAAGDPVTGELCENGPAVPAAVDRMVATACDKVFGGVAKGA